MKTPARRGRGFSGAAGGSNREKDGRPTFFYEKSGYLRGESIVLFFTEEGWSPMLKKLLAPLLAAAVVLLAGCGKEAPEAAPGERNQLLIRLFNSLDRGDYAAAMEQAAKLRTLDPGNAYLSKIVETQRANRCIQSAQERFDAGRIDEAIAILVEGEKQMPLDNNLPEALETVRRIDRIEQAFRAYAAAADLNIAGKALETLELETKDFASAKLAAAVKRQRDAYNRRLAEAAALQKHRAEPPKMPDAAEPPAPAPR